MAWHEKPNQKTFISLYHGKGQYRDCIAEGTNHGIFPALRSLLTKDITPRNNFELEPHFTVNLVKILERASCQLEAAVAVSLQRDSPACRYLSPFLTDAIFITLRP